MRVRTGPAQNEGRKAKVEKPLSAGTTHTKLLLPVVSQQQQLWVQGHLTQVLGRLAPGFLFIFAPRRRGFRQKPIFLLGEADPDDKEKSCPWNSPP